jgi:hypothetical protein
MMDKLKGFFSKSKVNEFNKNTNTGPIPTIDEPYKKTVNDIYQEIK